MNNIFLRLNLLLVLMSLLFSSCTKKKSVHFHGIVTYLCNGKPFPNGNLEILRVYDNGTYQQDIIGNAITDNAGNYSIIVDVSQSGSFKNYGLLLQNGPNNTFLGIGGSSNDSPDVLMDGGAYSINYLNIHIKNTTPYNTYDSFDTLQVNGGYKHGLKLLGMNVDTLITFNDNSNSSSFSYSYSFTKQSVTAYGSGSVQELCLDTAKVNLFY